MRTTSTTGCFSRWKPARLGSFARPVASVACDATIMPLRPHTSTSAPPTGWPLAMLCTNTSRVPSSDFLATMPRSVTSTSRSSFWSSGLPLSGLPSSSPDDCCSSSSDDVSVASASPSGFFFALGSKPCTLSRNTPRRSLMSLRRYSAKSTVS